MFTVLLNIEIDRTQDGHFVFGEKKMVIVIKQNYEQQQLDNMMQWVKQQGVGADLIAGSHYTMLVLIGDTKNIDVDLLRTLDIVQDVRRIQEPYKCVNRKFHPDDTIVDVSGHKFGGDNFQIIAGPCSVESEKQVIEIAKAVKKAGATVLRGGAYKPRTSPYTFQGLKQPGLQLLLKAKRETGMPIVTEIMSASHIDQFGKDAEKAVNKFKENIEKKEYANLILRNYSPVNMTDDKMLRDIENRILK